jgi:hypothetical protein
MRAILGGLTGRWLNWATASTASFPPPRTIPPPADRAALILPPQELVHVNARPPISMSTLRLAWLASERNAYFNYSANYVRHVPSERRSV